MNSENETKSENEIINNFAKQILINNIQSHTHKC